MAAFGLETHKLSHSELTTGRDVEDLLSQINGSFKQSKADQILRLLKDQDRLTKKLEECDWDDESILKSIKEDTVKHDSDTLTDDSVDESDKQTEDEKVNVSRHRWRCKTAIGFYTERTPVGLDISDDRSMDGQIVEGDTRFNRPKSSYVRRKHFKRRDEPSGDIGSFMNGDEFEPPPQRPTRSARPKSRLGRASVPEAERSRRRIALVEAPVNTPDEAVRPPSEDMNHGATVNTYDRYTSTKNQVSRMKSKGFCDDPTQLSNNQQPVDNMIVDTNSVEMKDEVQEIQVDLVHNSKTIPHQRHPLHPQRNVAPTPIHSPIDTSHSRSPHTPHHVKVERVQNRNTPSPRTEKKPSHSPIRSEIKPSYTQVRTESNLSHSHLRADSNLHKEAPHRRQEQPECYRPKNPEPISSRPISRPNARRRFQRRYMPQTATPLSNVRPTSESVILARQKTEKNLLKAKQEDNRPKSEKIYPATSKTLLSVSSNPAQGPQTALTSKAGVTQASHVPTTGFRGYEPGNRLKSGNLTRNDIPADLTLPRQAGNNVVLGSRNPLTLMKLPPLEATLAKKKEASLQITARETCV